MFYPDALGVDIPTPKLVRNAFYTQFFHVENIWGSHAHGHECPRRHWVWAAKYNE